MGNVQTQQIQPPLIREVKDLKIDMSLAPMIVDPTKDYFTTIREHFFDIIGHMDREFFYVEHSKHLEHFTRSVYESNYFLGKLEIYNYHDGNLEESFFCAKELVFHLKGAYTRIKFPKCKYYCEKITLSINTGLNPKRELTHLVIQNGNCPVEIELRICGYLDCEKKFKIEADDFDKIKSNPTIKVKEIAFVNADGEVKIMENGPVSEPYEEVL